MTDAKKGAFHEIMLRYGAGGLSNEEQAVAILTQIDELVRDGHPGGAITYSANEGQTDALEQAYASGRYEAGISGANQAEVMARMEHLLGTDAWSHLQLKARIAPITTIPFQSDSLEVVEADIGRIEGMLRDGWAILGWRNQSCDDTHRYAIGGGVKKLDQDVEDAIQNGLKRLAAAYPPAG